MTDIFDLDDWYWYQHEWDKQYSDLKHVYTPQHFPCIVNTEIRLDKGQIFAIHKFGDLI